MQNQLKPCPFCGNIKPELHTDCEIIYITCKCGITTTDYSDINDEEYIVEKGVSRAIEAWNTRPYQNEIDRLKIELHDMDSSAAEMRKDFNEEKARLEKEADWLATELAKFCSRGNCEGCEHSGRQWEEYYYCKILSLGVNSSQTWRKAARKAVEKGSEAHESAD